MVSVTYPSIVLDVNWELKSEEVISDFRISGESFINEICHNSRISIDNNIKLGPVTKLDKKNTATLILQKKNWAKKNYVSKTKGILVLKGIFSETAYVCVYFRIKFHVSSIILMSSWQGCNFTVLSPTTKRNSKKPTQIRVNTSEKQEDFRKSHFVTLYIVSLLKRARLQIPERLTEK